MPSYPALSLAAGGALFLLGILMRRSPAAFRLFPWISLIIFLAGFFSSPAPIPPAELMVRSAAFFALGVFMVANHKWAAILLPILLFSFDLVQLSLPAFAEILKQPPGWSYLVLRTYDAARSFRNQPAVSKRPAAEDTNTTGNFGVVSRFILQTTAFPTLLAGPILLRGAASIRARPFSFRHPHDRRAAALLVIGLVKILVILPRWNAHFETGVLHPFQWNLEAFRSFAAAGIYGYGKIYFDFSGAMDIAVGLSGLIGLRIPHNFRRPFLASSISDFWRRWHITLGAFVRRHIYIPMGGSRRGVRRTILNLIFAMTLIGLWHGLRWNFLIWGLLHAGAMVIERFVLPKAPLGQAWTMLRIVVTQIFVAATWAVFFW